MGEEENTPIFKPRTSIKKSINKTSRNTKSLITNKTNHKYSSEITTDAAMEWKQNDKKRKYGLDDIDDERKEHSNSNSPQKKRKIVNGEAVPIKAEKLKLLKQKIKIKQNKTWSPISSRSMSSN